MDFGTLPPEINSARMYAGAGSASLLVAATAWDGLAAQLRSAAAAYSSVISGLTASWQGPSAAAMAAAAAPYATWMSATAAQAEQAATQAKTAAAAYETAFGATVPPAVITANRSQLASLVATNLVGQNTPAIAAAEAQYAGMWAQDAAAMYVYAGSSAAATQLEPFSPAPETTNPAGAVGQSAAVMHATGTAAGANAQSAVAQLMSATPHTLQSLATPAAAAAPSSLTTLLQDINSSPLVGALGDIEFVTKATRPANDAFLSTSLGLVASARTLNDMSVAISNETGLLSAGLGTAPGALASAGVAGSAVSAEVGSAGLVGALSVPPSWTVATPTVRLAATVLQGTGAAAAPTLAADSTGLLGQLGLASLTGGALGTAVPRTLTASADRSGVLRSSKSSEKDTPEKIKRVLAQLSQNPESVQRWHTDKAHLDGLLEQLSGKPGIHAVHVASADKPRPPRPKARWG